MASKKMGARIKMEARKKMKARKPRKPRLKKGTHIKRKGTKARKLHEFVKHVGTYCIKACEARNLAHSETEISKIFEFN